jgi:hypothetical protein
LKSSNAIPCRGNEVPEVNHEHVAHYKYMIPIEKNL